jgi:hypothetical protein
VLCNEEDVQAEAHLENNLKPRLLNETEIFYSDINSVPNAALERGCDDY